MAKANKTTKKTAPAKADNTNVNAGGINTDLAAKSAAAFLVNRVKQNQTSAKPESSDFKKLKAGILTPSGSVTSSILGGIQSGKPQQNTGYGKQVGHNQTIGANHSRTGVPRRTSGG